MQEVDIINPLKLKKERDEYIPGLSQSKTELAFIY